MAAALPFIGAGLGLINTVEGASAQGKQNAISDQQLQQAAYQQHLGRLLGMQNASGNPFGAVYAQDFQGAPDPYEQQQAGIAKLKKMGF